ncbi:PREDICTED: receptor-type tyrosine-protein phosphatase N2 [Ceratosolen solmsi marchali]|uniref:Receptor-type tyrosine-protein phosphatase N2 n=1 Tax=Ceratosolen solmsi marchali TaxID=326594 RepID=A0AAJ6YM60_9HYME|nr:PREDICTED: receptor-type tyrosine-protein phosphatase N2 [Ceratosolen solmsi marchali]
MGRKRLDGLEVPLLLLCVIFGGASSHGEVGCLFSTNLCKSEVESCYNDLAFGRCIELGDDALEKDLYQYDLEPEELELLRMQLERLEHEGYKWSHDYTQCIMQILLDDLRYRLNNDVEHLCKNLKFRDEDIYDEENEIIDNNDIESVRAVEPIAIVKFTPSKINPHGEFADEFYYPPDMKQKIAEERRKADRFDDYDESFYDKLGALGNPTEVYRRGSRSLNLKSMDDSPPLAYGKENYAIPREYAEALRDFLSSEANLYEDSDNDQLEFLPNNEKPVKMKDEFHDYEKTFSRKYKSPSEPKGIDFLDHRDEKIHNNDDNDDYIDDEIVDDRDFINNNPIDRTIIDSLADQSEMFSEGGTTLPFRRGIIRPEEYDDVTLNNDFDDMLWRRELAGFKRRERLDVKKPGPPFSTNNYAFKTQSPNSMRKMKILQFSTSNEVVHSPQVKKEIYNLKVSSSPKTYENVDLDHVYIQFNQEFHSWSEGEIVVNTVGSLLGLQSGELKEIRVGRAEVTFKVPKNSKNYNSTDIVNKINGIRNDLQDQLNIQVIRAGIGDKVKLPAILEVSSISEMSSNMFGALVAAGVAAVSAAAIVILVIARRHAKSRAKLAALRTPDPEASKDYQELCRARMHAKQSDKLSESPKGFDFGRLIESGKSESKRSSTSSWGEEPQPSSMDISTGHIVLSYMEDHLKNQEKLDEEWAALCAYEAEPCSTTIAEAEVNRECNRSDALLPYDHARVILNDLANINNSDYINASTITDHDPRNPAYIATQGPLPRTTADFWQLAWEQGSVVIIMLNRLTEVGQATCHRYWPDEGSELYHIFEVHLVSEHIWCDDYLVRSFYLKNLRTTETRTVTQFHFLSWPQDGVPQSTKALLEFRRKVNKSYRGRSCPIIVHCSDGAGRTGTYCLIDMVLNRMTKGAKEIDIAATLEHIRDQRAGMVATKQQYEFVLMAVADEVHGILKSLPIVDEKSGEKSSAASQSSTSPAK